ncbi:MAG: hypothetical protein Q8869_02645, partial [Candidatus Phytoplasma australasiaticum]|nr:hypothetical protein [Candidatus Phytoplasma australasiaticum]
NITIKKLYINAKISKINGKLKNYTFTIIPQSILSKIFVLIKYKNILYFIKNLTNIIFFYRILKIKTN